MPLAVSGRHLYEIVRAPPLNHFHRPGSRTTLMMEAALFEAERLGVRYSVYDPPPLEKPWPYVPERGEEATGVRLTITMSLTTLELVGRAAEHVGTSEPLFLIGSVLAYIGRLQRQFQGTHVDPPALAAEIRRRLGAIRLPRQYQYRVRGQQQGGAGQ